MLLKNSKETKRRKKCRKKVRTHKTHRVSEVSATSNKHGANVGIGLGAIAAILSPTALNIVQAAEVPVTSETMTSQAPVASKSSETEIPVPVQGSESSSVQSEEPVSSSESIATSESQSSSEATSSSTVSSGSSSSTATGSSNSENHQTTNPSTSSSASQGESSSEKQPTATTSPSKPLEHYSPSNGTSKPVDGEKVSGDGSISFSKNQTTSEFIEKIGEDSRQIAGENDLYASVMIAQAILESGSGNSQLSSEPNFNLFGIKGSYEGSSVEFSTQEDNGSGSMYSIQAGFRKYPSYKESLEDYVQLLKGGVGSTSDFYHGVWKSNTETYKDATQFLTGRYATDTQYNLKLNGLIEAYDLTQYDHPKETNDEEMVKVKQEKTYTISEKDTLWDIANNHNVSVPDLIKWNNLETGMIHEGETLVIGYDEVEMKKEEVAKLPPEKQAKVEAVQKDIVEQDVHLESQNQKEAALSTISRVGNRLAKSMGKLDQDSKTDVGNNYKLTAVQKSKTSLYKVKEGDSLKSIAKETGIPVKQLKQWNELDGKILSTGQYLRLSSPDYSLA